MAEDTGPIIQLLDVSKAFNGQPVLDGISLNIARGRTTAVIGPSGCGKTVLLKHMIGLLRPDNFALKGITCGHFRLGAKSTDPLDIAITASGSGHGVLVALAPDQARLEHQEPWTLGLLEDHRWFMKYDNILSLDLDNDGDLDLVTTEEQRILLSEGLGVLWYENKPCVE